MADIATLGIKVDASGATSELKKLHQELDATGEAGDAVTKIFEQVKSALESFGIALGAVELIKQANEARELGEQYESMGVVAQRLGAIHDETAKQIQTAEVAMRAQGLSMLDARDATLGLTRANIDLANGSALVTEAQNLAAVSGESESDAMNDLILAVQTGNDRVLKHAGLQVDLSNAVTRAAAAMGVSVDQLSESQAEHIRLNAALQAGTALQGAYAAALHTGAGEAQQAAKNISDLHLMVGLVFSTETTGLITKGADAIKAVHDWAQKNPAELLKIFDAIKSVAIGIGTATAAWAVYTVVTKGALAVTAILGAGETVMAFIELAKGIETAADAMALLELASAPVLAAVAAIGALIAYKFLTKDLDERVKKFKEELDGLGTTFKGLGGHANDGTQSSVEALQRLADMQRTFPGIIVGLNKIGNAYRMLGADSNAGQIAERAAQFAQELAQATQGLVGHDKELATNLVLARQQAQVYSDDSKAFRDAANAGYDQVAAAKEQVKQQMLVGDAVERSRIEFEYLQAVMHAKQTLPGTTDDVSTALGTAVAAAKRVHDLSLQALDVSAATTPWKNLLGNIDDGISQFASDLLTKPTDAFHDLTDTIRSLWGQLISDLVKMEFEKKILPKLTDVLGLNGNSSGTEATTGDTSTSGAVAGGIGLGTILGVGAAITGGIALFSSIFSGESEAMKSQRAVLDANTEATKQNTLKLNDLETGAANAANVSQAVRAFMSPDKGAAQVQLGVFASGGIPGADLQKQLDAINPILKNFGLTFDQVEATAKAAGLDLVDSQGRIVLPALEKFADQLDIATKAAFMLTKSFNDQLSVANLINSLQGKTQPSDTLKTTLGTFATAASGLGTPSTTDLSGTNQEAWRTFLTGILQQEQAGTLDYTKLGNFSNLQDFNGAISTVIDALNGMDNALSDVTTNVPAGFKVALDRFNATVGIVPGTDTVGGLTPTLPTPLRTPTGASGATMGTTNITLQIDQITTQAQNGKQLADELATELNSNRGGTTSLSLAIQRLAAQV